MISSLRDMQKQIATGINELLNDHPATETPPTHTSFI